LITTKMDFDNYHLQIYTKVPSMLRVSELLPYTTLLTDPHKATVLHPASIADIHYIMRRIVDL